MKKIIKIYLIILVIFSLIQVKVFAEEDDDSLAPGSFEDVFEVDKETELNELSSYKDDLSTQVDDSNSELEYIQDEISATVIEIAELSQNIYDKQTEIDELEARISIFEETLSGINEQLSDAEDSYRSQKELLEKRLVALYEIGNTSYLDILLNSKGISDFISNYYYISEIASTDSALLQIVSDQKENIQNLKDSLLNYENELNNSRIELTKSSIALSNLVIIKNQKMQDLSLEEMELQSQIEEYQAQIQEIESEIKILTLSSDNPEYVGGDFIWPVPGYTRISSSFGMRTHPITGIYKLHTGTDIGAPMGVAFVAANDGVVRKAGYNGAYGNMVIIDHGGGISTLYAHGSQILVEEGQLVSQGTQVLNVGSTGYSTGPHAHFEIRINSEYVNPMDYLVLPEEQDNNEKTEAEVIEIDSNE